MPLNIFTGVNNKIVNQIYYGLIIVLFLFYFIALMTDRKNKAESELKLASLRHKHTVDCQNAEHAYDSEFLTVDQIRTLIQLESHKCDESITKKITQSIRNGAILGFTTGLISSDLTLGVRNAITIGLINGVLTSIVNIADPLMT